ncbi:MAG: lamin tail domain-containing protein, partial [Acidobacteria bacterium]|nr:lamin tail domain-containing protein [Acidobacteriota bacterium]
MTLAWPLVAVSLVLGTRSTVGAAAPPRVVLNEIHYHPASDLQTDEFLELHNAGATPVSLAGWTLRGGLEFAFPDSAAIEPGAYLVLARDPARIAALHALDVSQILGPWVGALANEGETIELAQASGSTVDRIPYLDAYPWPEAPDGGGPSLERIDASRRGDTPRNWAASGNGGWIDIHLAGTASSSRLYLYLEGAGECFIDDLVVTQSSAPGNLLPDGGFEAGLDGWVSSGTHAGSVRRTLDAASGSASLRIVATGAGRGASDGLTIEVPGLGGGAACTLDFRARPREGN